MMRLKKLFILFLAAGVLVGCGKETGSGDGETKVPPIGNIGEIVQTQDKVQLVGRTAEINNVTVTDVPGNYVFWVGGVNGSIPVVLESELYGQSADGDLQIRQGQTLAITGTIRLVSAVSNSDKMWDKIDRQEKDDLDQAKVYLGAQKVRITNW